VPFTSLFFLFFFLPVTLAVYHLAGPRWRNFVLLLGSLLFYAWGGILQLPVLLASIAGNYVLGELLGATAAGWRRRLLLTLGIGANLAPLAYFKYTAFLLHNIHLLWPRLHLSFVAPQEQHVPLGISFLTFHAISYLVDIACNKAPRQKNPLHLALYLSLFPKLLAGPILCYSDAAGQLNERRRTLPDFALGVERFIIGLAKKMLLANPLAAMANDVFAVPVTTLSIDIAWLGIVCYTLQIFFDFSGYSDMAIGLGRMFGFHLPENFNSPYLAQSVREFWQRWHITLSRWFRDYLYIPLGGNRHGLWRTCINLMVVFLLCGLWHGASWNFIVWGVLHGGALVLERWRLAELLRRLPRIFRHLYLLLFLLVSWVFFRSSTLEHAWGFLGAMLSLGTTPRISPWVLLKIDLQLAVVLGASFLSVLPCKSLLATIWTGHMARRRNNNAFVLAGLSGVKVALLSALLLLAVMELAAGTHTPFIYFRF